MSGRFVDLLKYSVLAFALLNLTLAVGCGDGATIEPPVSEEELPDDPLSTEEPEMPPPEEEGK